MKFHYDKPLFLNALHYSHKYFNNICLHLFEKKSTSITHILLEYEVYNITFSPHKERAIHRSLLECSALIDAEDAIQPKSKNVFSGWEPVCDIFVSRDETLLVVAGGKDRRPVRKREITYKGDVEEASSDSDTEILRETPTPIPTDKLEQKDKKKTIPRRPASTTHTLPQLPSPTPSPPSTAPHGSTSSFSDEGRRDFLPKIESKPPHRKVNTILYKSNISKSNRQRENLL